MQAHPVSGVCTTAAGVFTGQSAGLHVTSQPGEHQPLCVRHGMHLSVEEVHENRVLEGGRLAAPGEQPAGRGFEAFLQVRRIPVQQNRDALADERGGADGAPIQSAADLLDTQQKSRRFGVGVEKSAAKRARSP
jgi:hypothetical protein